MPENDQELIKTFLEEVKLFEESAVEKGSKVAEILNRLESEFSVLKYYTSFVNLQKKEHARLQNLLLEYEENGLPQIEKLRRALNSAWLHHESIKNKVFSEHNSIFLRFVLGKVNVRVFDQADKIRMKDEYNNFKIRTAILFIVLPITHIVFNLGATYRILHHFWMLYLYLSLAIRENILCENGSRIKPWWIYHHYMSALVMILSIVTPYSPDEYSIYRNVLKLFVLQGAVMLGQHLYQASRQYARVATGKASPLDVALSDTIVERPSGLSILLPLLALTYVFEIYMGGILIHYSTAFQNIKFPFLVIGMLLTTMGIGNGYTVLEVLGNKGEINIFNRNRSENKSD